MRVRCVCVMDKDKQRGEGGDQNANARCNQKEKGADVISCNIAHPSLNTHPRRGGKIKVNREAKRNPLSHTHTHIHIHIHTHVRRGEGRGELKATPHQSGQHIQKRTKARKQDKGKTERNKKTPQMALAQKERVVEEKKGAR